MYYHVMLLKMKFYRLIIFIIQVDFFKKFNKI
jgi:hypothetical protein